MLDPRTDAVLGWLAVRLAASRPVPATQPPSSGDPDGQGGAVRRNVAVTFFNRPIVSLRARVLGRSPQERAVCCRTDPRRPGRRAVLPGPVDSQPLEGGSLITVGCPRRAGADACGRRRAARGDAARPRRPRRCPAAAGARRRSEGACTRHAGFERSRSPCWVLARRLRRCGESPACTARSPASVEPSPSRTITRHRHRRSRSRAGRRAWLMFERQVLRGVVAGRRFRRHLCRRSHSCSDGFPTRRPWGDSMRGFLLATVAESRPWHPERHAGIVHRAAHLRAGAFRGPADRRLVQRRRARPRQGSLDLSRDGAADAPPADDAAVAVCDRHGVSVSAWKPDRRVQRRQRLSRPDAHVRVERAGEPDHERLHDHLLSCAESWAISCGLATSRAR